MICSWYALLLSGHHPGDAAPPGRGVGEDAAPGHLRVRHPPLHHARLAGRAPRQDGHARHQRHHPRGARRRRHVAPRHQRPPGRRAPRHPRARTDAVLRVGQAAARQTGALRRAVLRQHLRPLQAQQQKLVEGWGSEVGPGAASTLESIAGTVR